MNKHLTILIFILAQNIGFGQLIITGGLPDDHSPRSESFHIDTIKINGDSTFYEVSEFNDSVLVHKEQQISIADEPIIFHGATEQWYPDGSKKLQGQFEFGEKKGLWKYWDEKGNLTQDIDAKTFVREYGPEKNYMLIDGEKIMKRK